MTALLFHGEGAKKRAVEEALQKSTALYEFGGDTLSTDDARSASLKMAYPPVGIDLFCVVIGAVDRARGSATDALLKSIEEHEDFVQPILWANSLFEVPPTIRSRCHIVWASGESSETVEELYKRIAGAAIDKNYAELIIALGESDLKPPAILHKVGSAISEFDFSDVNVVALWMSVRSALHQNYVISKHEMLGVLCI